MMLEHPYKAKPYIILRSVGVAVLYPAIYVLVVLKHVAKLDPLLALLGLMVVAGVGQEIGIRYGKWAYAREKRKFNDALRRGQTE